jgi:hypothetical protein
MLGFLVTILTGLPPPATSKSLQENSGICAGVEKALGSGAGAPPSLYVESVNGEGRGSVYMGIDLDGDGDADSVKQDCGSPSYGTCILYVGLSRGGGYEFEEEFFNVIRFRSKYYVLVGDTYPERNTHRRLYLLNVQRPVRVCKSF